MKSPAFFSAVLLAISAGAQTYTIDWYKIAGGGGISSSGAFSVNGTAGQPDASTSSMSGGPLSLQGGFWSFLAVPTPGAPLLTIFSTPTNTVVVSWPSPSSGWHLQQSTDLATGVWTTPAETVQDNGTTKFIVANPPVGRRWFRLTSL